MRLVSTWAKNTKTNKWECLAELGANIEKQIADYKKLITAKGVIPAKGKKAEKKFSEIVLLDSRRPYKKHRLG